MRIPTPTSLGVKAVVFYGILIGSFYASTYSNLFFLLLAFLTVLGLLNVLWTGTHLRGVSAELADPEPFPAGAPAEFKVRVHPGRRARYGVAVRIRVEGRKPAFFPAGLVDGETTVRGTLPSFPRGIHRIEDVRLVSAWPLGLLSTSIDMEAPAELVAYPTPLDLGDAPGGPSALGDVCGLFGAADGGLQPTELRDHRPGDGLSRIHWKASARRNELVVVEWEGGGGAGTEVVFDRRAREEEFEISLRAISALAQRAREEKELITLHSQGLSATYGTGHRPFGELLRFLAAAEPLPPNGSPPPPVSPGTLRLPAPHLMGGRT